MFLKYLYSFLIIIIKRVNFNIVHTLVLYFFGFYIFYVYIYYLNLLLRMPSRIQY